MSQMNRRSFFSRVLGGIAAVVTAPFLPKAASLVTTAEQRRIALLQQAFIDGVVIDRELGIRIRFVKQWDMNTTNKF